MKYRLLQEQDIAGVTVWNDLTGPQEAEPGQTAGAALDAYGPAAGHWLVLDSAGGWREFNVKTRTETSIEPVEYEHLKAVG